MFGLYIIRLIVIANNAWFIRVIVIVSNVWMLVYNPFIILVKTA